MTRRAFLSKSLAMRDNQLESRTSFITDNTKNSTNLRKKKSRTFLASEYYSRALENTLGHSLTILEASQRRVRLRVIWIVVLYPPTPQQAPGP